METFFNSFNNEQIKAIKSNANHICVFAGPGTGKTKTLVGKYVYLQKELGVNPSNILCITFTKKASEEMSSRIAEACGENRFKYISTIHSLANKILSSDIYRIGFPNRYSIISDDEQHTILFSIMSDMNLYEDETITFKDLSTFIVESKVKDNTYVDYLISKEKIEKKLQEINENILIEENQNNLVHLKLQKAFFMYVSIENNNYYLDYTDLIILSKRLLTENEIARKKWASKFQYILVDEFQDLTDDEYRLIELLSSEYNRIFAVGDPDQSIYRFRGSNIDIFNNFYKNADERYDFVENYRSYQEIINLSYDLISSNEDRVSDVKLHCVKGSNKVPKIVHTADRRTEAIFVANKIIELMKKGIKRSECAILYRNNQCSLVFEEYFQQKKIPYKVYSNNEFFNCDEIKTAISYLKFIIYKDNVSFLNIYKKPLRYISNVMIKRIKQLSSNNNVSYWEVIKDDYKNPIYKNCLTALVDFVKKIELINPNDNFEEWCLRVFNDSGFLKYVFSTGDEDKANHMKQLIDMIHSFELEDPSKNAGEEFLNYLALLSDGDIKEDEDKVQMMSIHCSKGMQYKYVFLVDFNEGYIPSSKVESKLDFAEERRIAYVAFTRAQEDFYILESNGEDNNGTVSSFYNSFQKCNFKMIDYVSPESKDVRRLMTGSYIRNKFFGNGRILSINTLDKTCVVKFDDYYKEKTVDLSSVMLILNKKDLTFTIDPNIVEKIKQSKSIVYEIGDIVIHEKYGAGIITKLKDENNAFIQFTNFGSVFDLSSNYLIKRNDYIQFVERKESN